MGVWGDENPLTEVSAGVSGNLWSPRSAGVFATLPEPPEKGSVLHRYKIVGVLVWYDGMSMSLEGMLWVRCQRGQSQHCDLLCSRTKLLFKKT